MDWANRNTKWPQLAQRERVQQVSDDVLAEKVYSSKRTRAGYLGAVTRVRGKIETLLNDPTNAETVRTLSQQYDNS